MIRKATIKDLNDVVKVIDDAKSLFKSEGSDQWQDTDNYPNYETMKKDLLRDELYVATINEEVAGCVVLSDLEEKAYEKVYDGNWISSGHYMVIHRIAVKKEYYHKGIAKTLIKYIMDVAKRTDAVSIRVDTKKENIRMLQLLKSFGFIEVGKIHLLRKDVLDKERVALELVL